LRYFVYAPNGQRFGPVDLPTLQQWVNEGRVLPNSLLEEEIGGQRMAASTILDLRFPPNTPYVAQQMPYGNPGTTTQNPYADPMAQPQQPTPYAAYHRPGQTAKPAATPELTTSWVCSSIATFLVFSCGCFPVLGFIATALAIAGLVNGKKARDNGHPQGNTAYIFSLVILVLSILSAIGGTIFMVAGMSGMGGFNF
jgi:hypothetical protein